MKCTKCPVTYYHKGCPANGLQFCDEECRGAFFQKEAPKTVQPQQTEAPITLVLAPQTP